ncbi:MAG: family 10 glycosylhydrolase [Bacteroidaceae bacterium]|nr:family 10 glycosylhydrolase [Bacteroidaceae bacterium]
MKRLTLFLFFFMSLSWMTLHAANPKREFRGAWIQCVNGQYLGKSPEQIRQMLSSQLDVLQKCGINAILFQVRAEGDALYRSNYEPWSRYLTGKQGTAPSDGWDPLAWMVDECHKRNMECHAWINPYRAKTKGTTELAVNHAVVKHPERVFEYDGLYIFNPALPENRTYTCMVVEDILEHYDVDGIHMDDYFYPYPVKGLALPDESYFQADPRGFATIEDWRRDNVSLLIRDLHYLVRSVKPWVKFGVSPFGIYRNSPTGENCREGSATSGTQNYDDLYADIVQWTKQGWVDYNIPQIYWNIGTKAADYEKLLYWWNDYCNQRPLFIGQDVERTVKGADPSNPASHQMRVKYDLQRALAHVQGSCQWYAAAVVNNPGNYRTVLEQVYHATPALQPLMTFIDGKAPGKPKSLSAKTYAMTGTILSWEAPKGKQEMDKARQYVIYRFKQGEKINLNSAENIVAITQDTRYTVPSPKRGTTFVVTALDRLHNESKPAKVKL